MTAESKAFYRGRLPRIIIGGLFTVGVIWLMASAVTMGHLGDVAANIDMGLALLALLSYIGVTSLRAWRYKVAGATVPFHIAFQVAALHSALLRVMPFRSGEFAYGILMRKAGGSNFITGMASIFLLRVLDLAVVLPLAAIVIAVKLSGRISGIGIVSIALAGILLSAVFFLIRPLIVWTRENLPQSIPERLRSKLLMVIDALLSAYDIPIKRRLLLVGITSLLWASLIVWCHFTFRAIGATTLFDESIVASVLGFIGSILPLSLWGSFGPMEGGFALGFSFVGQTQEASLANALVGSTLTLIVGFVVAGPSWVEFWLSAKEREGKTWAISVRRALGSTLFSLAGGGLLLSKIPYGFETNDQYQYLLLPYRSIYNDFLPGDWFTWQTSHYHVTFSWLIRGLHALFGAELFPFVIFGLHVFVLVLLSYALLALARAMRLHWGAAGIAVLAVSFVSRTGIGETVVNHGVLLPADIALPFLLLGLCYWIVRKNIRAGLFLGLAGLIHANFAVLGPLVIAVPELVSIIRTRQLRSSIIMMGAFVVVASPTLIATISAFFASDSAPDSLTILFNIRSPHHYNFSLSTSSELFYTLTLIITGLPVWIVSKRGSFRHTQVFASLVGAMVIASVATVSQQPLLVRLFFWRLSIPLLLLSTLAVGEIIVGAFSKRTPLNTILAISAVSVLAAFSANGAFKWSPDIVLRGYAWMLPASLGFVVVIILGRFHKKTTDYLCLFFAAIPVVVAILVSRPVPVAEPKHQIVWAQAKKKWSTFSKFDKRRIFGLKSQKPIYSWIRKHAPKDALFLIPPGNNDFRFATGRGIFVDWKCCPMKGDEIQEWRRRMLAAMGVRDFPAKGYRLYPASNKRFLARPLTALADLARREGMSHILVKKREDGKQSGLKRLVTRSGWSVYEVLSR